MKKLTSAHNSNPSVPMFESTFGFCLEDLMGLTKTYRSTSRKIFRLRPEYDLKASRELARHAQEKNEESAFREAFLQSRQSLLNHPFNAGARHTLACSLEALGYHDEALEQYRFALLVGQGRKREESLRAAANMVNQKGNGVSVMLQNNKSLQKTIQDLTTSERTDINRIPGIKRILPQNHNPRKGNHIIRIAWVILLMLFFSPGLFAQENPANVSIQGRVVNQPHGAFPATTITAKNPDTGETLGSTQTDEQGFYQLDLSTVDVSEPEIPADHIRLFPNPFGQQAFLQINIPLPGRYQLLVADILGRLLIQKDLLLQPGKHLIPVSLPPSQGPVIFVIRNQHFQQKIVGIQQKTYLNEIGIYNAQIPEYQILDNINSSFISSPDNTIGHDRFSSNSVEQINLAFVSEGHNHKDTTLTWNNHNNVNVVLQVTPKQVQTPYTILVNNTLGNVIPGAEINVYPNEETQTIIQGNTNQEGILNAIFEQTQWIYQTDTIQKINQLRTNAEAAQHEPKQVISPYANPMNLELTLTHTPYQYTVPINLESTNPDKTPLSFRAYVLQEGDTLAVQNFTGTQGTLNFEGATSNMNVVVGAINIPHFDATQKNATMNPGENAQTLNTNPIIYSYNVSGNVLYENENPAQANVSAEDQNANTNAQGAYSLVDIIRQTNTNNAPLTYNTEVTATGDFETQTKNILVDGANKTVNFTIPNPMIQYALIINLESNNPDKIPLSFRGYVLQEGDTLAVQNFQGTQGTLNFESTMSNMNVVVGARNIPHFGPTQKNATINPGENQETLNTNPIVYLYNVSGNVLYENSNPVQANVSAEGQNTNTNTQGAYSLVDIIRNTNTNNAPLTYTAIVSATGDFETQNKDITVDGQNKTVNFEVPNPPPVIREFNITPYTATNIPLPELTTIPFTLHIRTMSDNQVHSFTQQGNNPIQVTLEGYSDAEQIKMWHNGHSNASMNLSDLMIIEYNTLDWRAPNVAQNRIVREWEHGQTLDTLTTNIGHITNPAYKDQLELYMPEYWYETNNGTVNFNGNIVMTMLANREGTPANTIHNWKGNHVPYVERMIFDYILDPNDPWNNTNKISQEKLDEMINISQGIDQYAISATGRIRMPVVYTIVSAQEDPAVQAAIARGWDYTSSSWRQIGQPDNGVTLDFATNRIRYGSSRYSPQSSLITITEEEHEKTAGSSNAPNNTPSTNLN